jgi:CheY-like chemotaxis protein
MARILVVDDHRYVRLLVKLVLEAHQHTLLEATDGSEALAFLDEIPSAIDLILLDLLMPKLDGYAFLSRIQAHQLHVPIVILSTLWPLPDMVNYPISGHLAKPFTRQKLLDMVQRNLPAQAS